MEINHSSNDKWQVLALNGELNIFNSKKLGEKVKELLEEGKNSIIIDLNGVQYMDSSGITSFIYAESNIRKAGGTLRLANLDPKVLDVMKASELDQKFEIFPDLDSAINN